MLVPEFLDASAAVARTGLADRRAPNAVGVFGAAMESDELESILKRYDCDLFSGRRITKMTSTYVV